MKLIRKYIRELISESDDFEWTPEMRARWDAGMEIDRQNAEHVHGVGHMNPDVVYDQLNQPVQAGMYDGETYLDMIFDAFDHENWPAIVNFILEALWIDDSPRAGREELETLLMDVQNEDDLVGVIAEWIPRYWKVNDHGRILGKKPKWSS